MRRDFTFFSDSQDLLDFTGLPLGETAALLRCVAISLIDQLLEDDCPFGETPEAVQPPKLLEFLSKGEVRLLSRAKTWKMMYKYPFRHIPRNLRERLPKTFKKMTNRAMKGKLRPKQWQIAANNRFALAIGGTKGDSLPDNFWPVAGHLAWTDPEFQMDISLKLYQWLRHRVLFNPYEPPAIHLSPNVFWFMILLSHLKPPKLSRWLSGLSRSRVRLAKRLQEEAVVNILTNEWAGIWEQWLIRLMIQRWPSGFKGFPPRLVKAMNTLHLLQLPMDSDLFKGKKKHKVFSFSIGDKWFDKIDRIHRLKRPAKDLRKAVLVNLSTKDCQEQAMKFPMLFQIK